METFHNPDRFMSDLRQVLSQGRKRIGILVGAGAPLAIRVNEKNEIDSDGKSLIPGVEALTVQATTGLSETQMAAVEAIKESLGSSANIESILSRIRLLEQALGKTVVQGLDSEGYKKTRQGNLQKYCQGCWGLFAKRSKRLFRLNSVDYRNGSF